MGTPDFLGVVNGWMVALELKATAKDKPTELQVYNLAAVAKAGGIALVACPENWQAVLAFLDNLSKRERTDLVENHFWPAA